jgi:4-hydroxythreonine-4-phosphate dehydrogenase
MTLPRIGISLGDPGGIGPEIILKILSAPSGLPPARYIVFGSAAVLESAAGELGMPALRFSPPAAGGPGSPSLSLVDIPIPEGPVRRGAVAAANGEASFAWFREAVEAARRAELEAIVTAPIAKASWALAGLPWRGHTEYLEHLHPGAAMSFWSDRLTVVLLSHHLPLREALALVTRDRLLRLLRTAAAAVAPAAPDAREFLVAGLNPHAGEDGLLGSEERDEIVPAIEAARLEGIRVRGPFPPDVVFREALDRPGKVVVALYHDQGLIPFKLTSFATGVNVTLGLPYVRTSPDHGTAFDIVGKGAADPASLAEAVRLAAALAMGVL